MSVIEKQGNQPDQDHDRVTGKHPGLKHTDRMAEKTRELADEIHQAIDDPLIPPHGNAGKDAREPTGAVDTQAIDHLAVEEAERGAQILDAVDEQRVVDFVDVVLMNQKIVQPRPYGNKLRLN